MKKLLLIFAFFTSLYLTAFAQTKVNSGKNFVVYSYDNWENASSEYLKLCEEYNIIYPSIKDALDFSKQSYFTVKQGVWNFYIIHASDTHGIWSSLCISSPEGRQTELSGREDISRFNDYHRDDIKEKLNKLKLRYKFLGEPIS